MKVRIDPELQGSPEWVANRAKRYNASDLACAMGIDPNGRKRTELVQLYAIGREREFSEWFQNNVLGRGHEIEALARPIIESRIGEGLYPVVLVGDVGLARPLGASLDGLTAGDDTAFECKSRNAALWDAVSAGIVPEGYRPQCEQGMLLSGAEVCLFTVSDGTEDGTISCEYRSDPDLRARIIPTWMQFEADVENYIHVEHVERPAAEVSIELPALFVHAQGEITQHNMQEYGAALTAKLAEVRAIVLVTDQDFSNAKAAAAMFREQCKKLKLTKEAMLSQTVSIGEAARMIDAWHEDLRVTALQLEKDVEREDATKKAAIVAGAKADFADYAAALNARIGGNWMPDVKPDFAQAIKNKRTYASMQDSVNTLLANAKVEADEAAVRIVANRSTVGEDMILFPDFAAVCNKRIDDFHNLFAARVHAHREAEEKKLEETRAKIRIEEQKKAEAKAKADQEAEDALIAGIWMQARRIEGDSVPYIEKAIAAFESIGPDWAGDPRQRVATAVAEARQEMQDKLASARARAEQAERDAVAAKAKADADAEAAHAFAEAEADRLEREAEEARIKLERERKDADKAESFAKAEPAGPELARQAANEPAHADNGATLKLGDISGRLGFTVTADFLASIGFTHVATDKNAKLYRASDFPRICRAIANHVMDVAAGTRMVA